MLKDVLDARAPRRTTPVRLEVGAELMNSVVYTPERWEHLLAAAKKERHRLGLDGKVLLSHNFTHHIEIPDDFVGRMTRRARRRWRRYIRGLDVLSLSQYMDLTVGGAGGRPRQAASPAPRRSRRRCSAREELPERS